MLSFTDTAHVREVVDLAQELMTLDGLAWHDALLTAYAEQPDLTGTEAWYRPARIVWFDDAGIPIRLSANELMKLTGRD